MPSKLSHNSRSSKLLRKCVNEDYSRQENDFISKVLEVCANYLLKAETESGDIVFISIPNKFRNVIYISVGMYVASEPVDEGDKVKGILTAVLYDKHVRDLMSEGQWPEHFEISQQAEKKSSGIIFPPSSSDDDPLEKNTDIV